MYPFPSDNFQKKNMEGVVLEKIFSDFFEKFVKDGNYFLPDLVFLDCPLCFLLQ